VADKAGAYAGTKKYGDAANVPARSSSPSPRGGASRAAGTRSGATTSKVHKPSLDEMGIATWHEVKPASSRAKPRKPTLDEMGPGTESRIFKPKSMRDGGQEFGGVIKDDTRPRSTGGAPGKRGGWKRR